MKKRIGTGRDGHVIEQEGGTINNNTTWDRNECNGMGGAPLIEGGMGLEGHNKMRDGNELNGNVR